MRLEDRYFGTGPLEFLAQIGPFEILVGFLFFAIQVMFVIGVVMLIVRLVRGSSEGDGGNGGPGVQILEERYARGEITREEFMERRAVLRGQ